MSALLPAGFDAWLTDPHHHDAHQGTCPTCHTDFFGHPRRDRDHDPLDRQPCTGCHQVLCSACARTRCGGCGEWLCETCRTWHAWSGEWLCPGCLAEAHTAQAEEAQADTVVWGTTANVPDDRGGVGERGPGHAARQGDLGSPRVAMRAGGLPVAIIAQGPAALHGRPQ